ncbi:Gfo/Idh/MocA family protein [Pedobacter steynii]|uniref:Oxidoreductase n=1 Tax=Pedobacter steynii TaxID=430522 RepID=A0A1D7QE73_9SPHI|nr:Gfo/Idh/MocA family oxidoreductase [Pedobacter steynii]AOM76915.1 oxidoreductase [Pedobacter steynii]
MNVLIVGLGSIAQKHINALRKISTAISFFALRSSTKAVKVDGVSDIYDISVIPSLSIDFAIISNPTAFHKQAVSALIPFKIPLFIEKPVFDRLEVAELLQEIKKNNIITYVACNLRFLGCLVFLKEFLKGKRINEVNSYCGSYLPDWRPEKDFRTVYSANKEMGGGVHIDLIHEIDYLYWLFNAPVDVFVTKSNRSSLNISAVDYANYILSYPQYHVSVVLNYYRRDPKRSLEVLLESGTVYVDLLQNTVTFQNEIIYSSDKSVLDTYEDQLTFFTEEILKNNAKFNTIDEAFEVLKLCITND